MKSKILAICCIFAWCILLAFGFQVSSSQARNQEPNSLAQIPTGQTQLSGELNQKQLDALQKQLKKDLEKSQDGSKGDFCLGSKPPEQITKVLAKQPPDIDKQDQVVQGCFDLFSWNSFIALNWPANPKNCDPDMSKLITDKNPGPVVWETFSQDTDVFVKPQTKPATWCSQPNKPKQFSLAKTSPMVIQNLELLGLSGTDGDISQAVGGVLTDQNGRFVRYEKRLNHDEYNYIVGNKLWNKQGQVGQTIKFPSGSINPSQTGAIEIKAAWKVLTPAEINGGRFYTTTATVYNDAAGDPSPGPNPVKLGLVGLHITHKTKSQPNWIWSTFEHVDNAPTIDTGEMNQPHSFYKPCSGQNCEPTNTQTALDVDDPKELNPDRTPINPPIQVVRTTPIQANSELNKHYQNLLNGSVWANYELVSTQWTGELGTEPKPPFLANTTMETFIQKDAPLVTSGKFKESSCITCHRSGKDFSFLLYEAK